MSVFLSIRRWERPDRPQSVYTGALALWEAPLYVGIGAASQSYRMPDRRSDRTYVLQDQPAPAWIFTNLPPAASVAQLWPGIEQTLARSYRSDDRARLDVRRYEWSPEDGWRFAVVDAGIATYAPVWAAQTQSFRSGSRGLLDVRLPEWAPSVASWISQIPAPPAPTTRMATFITWNVSGSFMTWNVTDTFRTTDS